MTDIVPRAAVQARNIAFLCHENDEKWKNEISKGLTQMRRDGDICIINQTSTMPHLDIILIIVSPNLMGDDRCLNAVDDALAQQAVDQRIVPVIVQETNLKMTNGNNHPLAKMQGLPRDKKPLEEWRHSSQAIAGIVQGIQQIVRDLNA